MTRAPLALAVTYVSMLLLAACGGGGGGGSGGGDGPGTGSALDPSQDFFLTSAKSARPLFDVNGTFLDVVNPASLNETDPLSGVPLPGFPKPLQGAEGLNKLVSWNFQQILDPITPQLPVVARNGAIVLTFSRPVDASSLAFDQSEPDANRLSPSSPVQVRTKNGAFVPARAFLHEGKSLVLVGITADTAAFAASPVLFDSKGKAVIDPTGYMRIVLDVGVAPLESTDGKTLVAREDGLGTSGKPLPFNPGNAFIDAVKLQTDDETVSFNGFLPDLTAPRIIRAVSGSGTITAIDAVAVGPDVFVEVQDSTLVLQPNTAANGGLGEWANGLMRITTSSGGVVGYPVLTNFNAALPPNAPTFRLDVSPTDFDPSIFVGNTYTVLRTEFYEPIPAPPFPANPAQLAAITVDPENIPRDPDDPEDANNDDLRYFLRVLDEDGDPQPEWNPAQGLFGAVPPKSTLALDFNEPMDPQSARPYESFSVMTAAVDKGEPGFDAQFVGRVTSTSDARTLFFEPFLEDQFDPTRSAFIGFGGQAKQIKLVLRVRPPADDIEDLLASVPGSIAAEFVDLDVQGVAAITDQGGRSLGIPSALLDISDSQNFLLSPTSPGLGAYPPALDFEVTFQTQPTSDPEHGVIVHRFMGAPFSSVFTAPPGSVVDPVQSGVEYYDYPPEDVDSDGDPERRFIYGPQLFDIGLVVPGFLTGRGAQTIEHVMDDFNPPKPSSFSSPMVGGDTLAALGFGVAVPLNSPFGARFQHIYRAGDASPSYFDFTNTVLDLVGLAWSPLAGQVTTTVIQDIEILVGLSNINGGNGPNTNQNAGIPSADKSGLGVQFDCNLLEWGQQNNNNTPNCQPIDPATLQPAEPGHTPVVQAGTSYAIQASNLFTPANAVGLLPGAFNRYLNFPTFNGGVDLAFGNPNTFSFPYSSKYPMIIEYRIKPQEPSSLPPPATFNLFNFSPAILSSALPRFRVFSQGQDPLARGIANFTNGCNPLIPAANRRFSAGEGGPLLEPGTQPPPNTTTYVLPAISQPQPDATEGDCMSCLPPCLTGMCPTPNTNPEVNWYFANGMLAYPLPNLFVHPGPTGQPPTPTTGYECNSIVGAEPNFQLAPSDFGDNARYYMLWKYRKRVSVVESPTIRVDDAIGQVEYLSPILDPPLSSVPPAANLLVELRASAVLDFSVPALDSGYIEAEDVFGTLSGLTQEQVFVKFRTTFGLAPNASAPPALDAIVIPYRKVLP